MYFFCARFAQYLNEAPARRTPHDRIVYDDDALSVYFVFDRVEFDEYGIFPLFLRRCDKGSADVFVFDDTRRIGNARRPRPSR